jgi:hypothetical protein
VGASGHKFSSGSHAEAAWPPRALAFILDCKADKLEAAQNIDEVIAESTCFELFEYKDTTTGDQPQLPDAQEVQPAAS